MGCSDHGRRLIKYPKPSQTSMHNEVILIIISLLRINFLEYSTLESQKVQEAGSDRSIQV